MFFPPEILGAHVSASPNHQTHLRHTLAFRAIVALAYHLGVELNPLTLSADDRNELADWIALHKRLRPVLHGDKQFHLEPVDGRYVWGACSEYRIVIIVAQGPQMVAEQPPPLRIALDDLPQGRWRIASVSPVAPDFIRQSDAQNALLAGGVPFSTATLVAAGLPLPMLRPESGLVLELELLQGA